MSACGASKFVALERFAQGGAAVVDQTVDLGRRASYTLHRLYLAMHSCAILCHTQSFQANYL